MTKDDKAALGAIAFMGFGAWALHVYANKSVNKVIAVRPQRKPASSPVVNRNGSTFVDTSIFESDEHYG